MDWIIVPRLIEVLEKQHPPKIRVITIDPRWSLIRIWSLARRFQPSIPSSPGLPASLTVFSEVKGYIISGRNLLKRCLECEHDIDSVLFPDQAVPAGALQGEIAPDPPDSISSSISSISSDAARRRSTRSCSIFQLTTPDELKHVLHRVAESSPYDRTP